MSRQIHADLYGNHVADAVSPRRSRFFPAAKLCCVPAVIIAAASAASDCNNTSVGFTPINDLGSGLYLEQFQGGLYPGGENDPPADHHEEGVARAAQVEPLDFGGEPDPDGKYILLSIGMSNTTQEYSRFIQIAMEHPDVNRDSLAIIDGAAGGQSAEKWESPDAPNYDRIRDQVLAPRGLSEQQVQAVWVKVANPQPSVSLPDEQSDAFRLVAQMGNIVRALRVRYPNVKVVFLSSRIYAGYASTSLNPEPYAYESGFAVKWLIEAQIRQMQGEGIDPRAGDLSYDTIAPWIAWGPYLWADGLVPRSDDLIWECADFANDGTHPATSGRQKVADMLLDFFLSSDFTQTWFTGGGGPVIATLTDFNIGLGSHISGTLNDVRSSDDHHLRTRSQFGFSAQEPNVMEIRFGATTNAAAPETLAITIESRINNPAGAARVRLRNWTTNTVDHVAQYAVGQTDEIVIIDDIDAADYVRASDGRIILAVRHIVLATFSLSGFDSFFDWVEIAVD